MTVCDFVLFTAEKAIDGEANKSELHPGGTSGEFLFEFGSFSCQIVHIKFLVFYCIIQQ